MLLQSQRALYLLPPLTAEKPRMLAVRTVPTDFRGKVFAHPSQNRTITHTICVSNIHLQFKFEYEPVLVCSKRFKKERRHRLSPHP